MYLTDSEKKLFAEILGEDGLAIILDPGLPKGNGVHLSKFSSDEILHAIAGSQIGIGQAASDIRKLFKRMNILTTELACRAGLDQRTEITRAQNEVARRRWRSVKNIVTGKVYPSIKIAAEDSKIKPTALRYQLSVGRGDFRYTDSLPTADPLNASLAASASPVDGMAGAV